MTDSAITMDRSLGDLLALDPSVNSPGISLFRHGVLVGCARVKIPDEISELAPAARCLRVANELAAWWGETRGKVECYVRTIIFEWPQIYKATKSKGNPNQLVPLAAIGNSLAAMLSMINVNHGVRPPELLSPTPAEWTGQLPKSTRPGQAWKSPRGKRIASRLLEGEREIIPAQHDAIDSLGLGLWALGRYDVHRALSGATRLQSI